MFSQNTNKGIYQLIKTYRSETNKGVNPILTLAETGLKQTSLFSTWIKSYAVYTSNCHENHCQRLLIYGCTRVAAIYEL